MGMIYKRKNSNKWWLKYYRNGKPYRESSGSTKESEAKRLLKKREGEIAQGRMPGVYFDRVRFDELADEYLFNYQVNEKKSLSAAENCVRHLREYFGGLRVTQITTLLVQAYIEYRSIDLGRLKNLVEEGHGEVEISDILQVSPENVSRARRSKDDISRAKHGASKASINRELSALKRMLNLGVQQTPPKVERVPYIPMLKENNTRKGFFEQKEFEALIEALPEYLRGFVTFGYRTGWRSSEIANLTWRQVDLDQGIVRLEVGETKNNEGRTVYLDEELKGVFARQREFRKQAGALTPYVFTNPEGTDKVKGFRKSWLTACKNAGLGKRLFHDLRRTAVRNMVRAGVPERVAMMVSGHKTRSVFDRYNIVSPDDLKLAAEKQEIYLRSQMGTVSGTVVDFETKKEVS
jgi:integrase